MKFKNSYYLIAFLLMAPFFLTNCNTEPEKKDIPKENQIITPDFSADSAFAFVKKQTDFGPIFPNSEAHSLCADYLYKQLENYCDTVIIQQFTTKAYNGTTLNGKNIIGSFGIGKTNRIVLAAHWDSRHVADHDPVVANRNKPIDGANDGASGVGVLLEIARQLSIKVPTVGIDIVFFDAEDYGVPEGVTAPDGEWGGLGSQYWAKNPHVSGYRANYGILLDMVGAEDAVFHYEYFSSYYAQDVLTKIWTTAYKFGFGNYFLAEKSHPITDDHYYVNTIAGIPMVDIIHQVSSSETGFTSTWHTLSDNIQHIDKTTLAAVGKTVLAVIYEEK